MILKDKVSSSERILVNNVQMVSRFRICHFGIGQMLVRDAMALGEGICPALWFLLLPSHLLPPPSIHSLFHFIIYSTNTFSFLRTKIIFDFCSMLWSRSTVSWLKDLTVLCRDKTCPPDMFILIIDNNFHNNPVIYF